MPATAVHVGRFQSHQGLITWDEAALAGCRIEPTAARFLHVAALLEDDTAITTRQATALGLHRSGDLAVFLPQWSCEEAEHGRALWTLLAQQTYEPPAPAPRTTSLRRRMVAHVPASAVGLLPQAPFLFCVLGAAAEYVATVIYAELAKQATASPVSALLRAIARQEARHFAFFLAAARLRGDDLSAFEGRTARRALEAMWEPIGVPTLGATAWHALFDSWLSDHHTRTRIERMDRIVDSIPHLAGAQLMASFLDVR